MAEPLVSLQGVTVAYQNGFEALRGLDLALYPGELVALMGENGSGKTTLAKLLVGLVRPSSGSVFVGGLDAVTSSTSDLARHVGLVFQNPDHQIFERTVSTEIAFGPGNLGLPPEETQRRVEEQLDAFGMRNSADRQPTSLSAGERKTLALASTLAMQPEVLLLDEPTRGMDYGRKVRLAQLGRRLQKEGRTVVFLTHDVEFAFHATERTVVLHRGKVLLDNNTRSALADPAIQEAGLQIAAIPRLALMLQDAGIPRGVSSLDEIARTLSGVH